MVGLSLAEKKYVEGGIAQGLRNDGRGLHDFRTFSVELAIIPQANGSARVRLGATDVIASIKAELGRPLSGRPNQGRVEINIECSPTAAPQFEGRGGDELSLELSRALQRSLLGGGSGTGAAIDLSALSVIEGKLCWNLFIDGLVLSSDGNLLDVLAIATKDWEYVTILKKLPKGMCTMKCKFWEHEWDGGPSRIRARILGLKGFSVDKCKSPPKHVRDVVQRFHVGLQANTPGAEVDVEVANSGQLGETFAGVEFDATGGMSSSVNVSASSSKKRKASGNQGSLSQSWNLQARKNANMAVRRCFYAEDITHFEVKSPYFVDMLRAIGEVGSSYKPPYEQLRGNELLEEVRCVDKDLYGVEANNDSMLSGAEHASTSSSVAGIDRDVSSDDDEDDFEVLLSVMEDDDGNFVEEKA
ncbi:hypothetical protein L7F22_059786 [Adiantum nelumboides]|nr:hypothetical protein [Adiantum nelumboides]